MNKHLLGSVFRVATVCLWTSLASAAAPPVVYHSPTMDGVNPGTPHNLANPTEVLDLYYSPGPMASASGEVCLDGSGDEICGLTVEIQSTGDVTLEGFTEDVTSDLVFRFTPPNSLKINRLNATAGDVVGVPIRLGSLQVGVGMLGGDVSVSTSSDAVGASLQTLAVVDNGTIATPEPGLVISLVLGAAAIGIASRRRQS